MTIRLVAAAALVLGACFPDEPTAVGSATADASSLVSLYPDIAVVGTAQQTARVTGTRDQFAITGRLANPQGGAPAVVSGEGTISGTTGNIHVVIDLLEWEDPFWGVTLTGTLAVDQSMTFLESGDELPNDLETHASGRMSAAEGTYDIDMVLCSRGVVTGSTAWGWEGTVGGAEQSDFTPGFDARCAPDPSQSM